MIRMMTSLCWIVSGFILAGCAASTTPPQASSLDVAPSYRGPYSRPLSDVPPANDAESKARVHTELGMEYLGLGRTRVALDEARVALDADSGYAPAHHLMGLIYMELEQDGQADGAFRRALGSGPGDPDFNNSYGWFLCRQRRFAEAMSHFATAEANPYYCCKARPRINAGLCLLESNDPAGAEVQFAKALEADPASSEALYQLARAGYRRGNYRRAHELLGQYHQRFDPSARSVWLGLCAARRLGEHHAEASYTEQLRGRFAGSFEGALLMQGKYE
ncbi:MAG: type IV pilus biogenesis/stability protein PilW [Azoarcus sp.]|jgi:type IV pilus assembly protein PilF|nr:type IV pilus biogenesis/stability protein PilW [Azoarcus sp.]